MSTLEQSLAQRARILLLLVDGLTPKAVSEQLLDTLLRGLFLFAFAPGLARLNRAVGLLAGFAPGVDLLDIRPLRRQYTASSAALRVALSSTTRNLSWLDHWLACCPSPSTTAPAAKHTGWHR
jgi:hypothetical protein